jgi:hypothetical protein
VWSSCILTPIHSLTGSVGQPFDSRPGGQQFAPWGCTHTSGIEISCWRCLSTLLWRLCSYKLTHSLTVSMGQPFSPHLCGQRIAFRDHPLRRTTEPGSLVERSLLNFVRLFKRKSAPRYTDIFASFHLLMGLSHTRSTHAVGGLETETLCKKECKNKNTQISFQQ